jgi:hypothetical protein
MLQRLRSEVASVELALLVAIALGVALLLFGVSLAK